MALDEAQLLWDDLTAAQRAMALPLMSLLKEHTRNNPISSADLAAHFRLASSGPIRAVVVYLRVAPDIEGMPCSLNSGGYWWSNDPVDIRDTYRHVEDRRRALGVHCRGIMNKYNKVAQLRMAL